ncbi:hypothetical protein CONLIGDRAFT_185986 [Coniochaeta ligniaria NRRL 30616]|uniref:EH domain-containing protein n=1 Tax=Coniochaeta ligniaria NRRL 30616 TaxID=1408157 RepID=A0A1J7J2D0_9PEZI|nr:hypothetical protein CONLIGDRAFT_185986 [Coniochaeta ligniaria NRRL 30616]
MTSPEANAALSAALKGATLAFNGQKTDTDKPKLKPKPSLTTPILKKRDSGALRAATQASRDHSTNSRSRSPTSPSARTDRNTWSRGLSRQATGGSVQEHGQGTHGRELEHGAVTRKLSQYLGSSPASPYLLSPGGKPGPDHRSASFIAATLAVSRSASPSPHHTGQGYFAHAPQASHSSLNPGMVRRRSNGASSVNSPARDQDLPDTSSIPPTNSLISMFEKQKDDAAPVNDPLKKFDTSPLQARVGTRPKLRARTPPRLPSPQAKVHPRENEDGEKQGKPAATASSATHPTPKPKPRPVPERSKTPPQIIRRAATEILSPEPRRLGPKPSLQPPAVRPRATVESLSTVTKPSDKPPTQEPSASTPSTSDGQPGPIRPGTEHPKSKAPALMRRTSASSASSDDTFVSASSTRSPRPSSPARGREGPSASVENLSRIPASKRAPSPPKPTIRRTSSMHTHRSDPTAPRRLRPVTRTSTTVDANHHHNNNNTSTSTLPLDSLTSAIMAGNLAANRAPPSSPALPPPLPAPRRHGHKHLHPHHHSHHDHAKKHHSGTGTSASLSPARQPGTLLTTLRHPASRSDSDEDHNNPRPPRRKPLQSKKKHAHHEGARKRWRDEVSPRERKRYEAVWASNRGLFADRLSPREAANESGGGGDDAPEDLVPNVVVRDIWSRSRLPFDELAEVWDLVYHGRSGGLNREEFVVGMWLIDQRLRGRKIPARVSDSVWESARGMRVKVPKGKK